MLRRWLLVAGLAFVALWLVLVPRDSPRDLVTPLQPLFRRAPLPPITVLLLLQQSEPLFLHNCLSALVHAMIPRQSVQLLLYDTKADHPNGQLTTRQSAILRTLARFPSLGSADVASVRSADSWAAAMNDAIPRCIGSTVLTLTDLIELEPGSVIALTRLLDVNPAASLVGGVLQDSEMKVHHAGYSLQLHGEPPLHPWMSNQVTTNVLLPVASFRGLPVWRAKHVMSATATALECALLRVDSLKALSRHPAATGVPDELAQVMLSLALRTGSSSSGLQQDDGQPAALDWLKPSQTYSARAHRQAQRLRRRAPSTLRSRKPLPAIPLLGSQVMGTMVGKAHEQLLLSADEATKFVHSWGQKELRDALQPDNGLTDKSVMNVTVVVELECVAADETAEAIAWVTALTELQQLRCVLVRFRDQALDSCMSKLRGWGFDNYALGELQRLNTVHSYEPSDPVILVSRAPQYRAIMSCVLAAARTNSPRVCSSQAAGAYAADCTPLT